MNKMISIGCWVAMIIFYPVVLAIVFSLWKYEELQGCCLLPFDYCLTHAAYHGKDHDLCDKVCPLKMGNK